MRYTCDNVNNMSKMIQIRNVPEDLHRELKVRAARAGMTLTDYLRRELERVVARPPPDEVLARIRSRSRPRSALSTAEVIRRERNAG